MQNELKTSTSGTVKTVHVQEGATVMTGASLVTVVVPEAWAKKTQRATEISKPPHRFS